MYTKHCITYSLSVIQQGVGPVIIGLWSGNCIYVLETIFVEHRECFMALGIFPCQQYTTLSRNTHILHQTLQPRMLINLDALTPMSPGKNSVSSSNSYRLFVLIVYLFPVFFFHPGLIFSIYL